MRIEILLVEDDARLHNPITQTLGGDYRVTIAESAAEARNKIRDGHFDTVLVDVTLPDAHGFELCKELRGGTHTVNTPVIFLTDHACINEKLQGFAVGGDDYISKPFHPDELAARVRARCRARVSRFRNLRINWEMQRVFHRHGGEEKDLHLTQVEFRILAALIRAPNRTIARNDLMTVVWGKNVHVGVRCVDKHVCTLRRKLGPDLNYIQTLPQLGYRFSDD